MKLCRQLIAVFCALCCAAKVVHAVPLSSLVFEDQHWKECIETHAGKHGWTNTEEFTQLKCHNKNIAVVDHLSHFSELKSLSLYKNDLTELDVSMLAVLKTLNVAANELSELNLKGLGQLEKLYAFNNQLENLDVSGLHNVTHMRLMNNKLETFDITPMTALQEGHLFNNQLTFIDLSPLTQLEFLDARQNPMPDELYDEFDEMDGVTISHDGNADDWK